jgi:hypothetical protein
LVNIPGTTVEKENSMKGYRILTILLAGAVLVSVGCLSRFAKEAVSGASGEYSEVQSMGPKSAQPLGVYRDIEVGKVTDDFGGRTPKVLLAKLPTEIRSFLREKKLPMGRSGKTLMIDVRVFYYEQAGAMGQVFGPLEEVVSEVKLVDKDTGKVIGEAICVGRTTTTKTQGVDHKVEGLAKAITKWIDERYPKAGR